MLSVWHGMGVKSTAQNWAAEVDRLDSDGQEMAAGAADERTPDAVPEPVRMGIVRTVRMIGGAMITILLLTVVLNEVFGAVNVGSGPFSGIADDLQTTGVTAMGLLVIGLLVVGANRLMGIFGSGGGGM